MTNALHDAAWLASLRTHPQVCYQLLGHLLAEAGPTLTMYWLDLFMQYGPKTGIPGLYTCYDVDTFGTRYEALIELRLREVYPSAELVDLAASKTFLPGGWPLGLDDSNQVIVPNARQHRRRRCRLAVWLSVVKVHQQNPPVFVAARAFDAARYRPTTPFLP